ncbi:hypothetical protein [Clostridium sp.]|uniref:hypothetical protein n=1 Tax=Clostridium sp. TaxID=1506 RepID=UPI0026369E65|nr:hypothetical protein [uncultured Clostridium sp.]
MKRKLQLNIIMKMNLAIYYIKSVDESGLIMAKGKKISWPIPKIIVNGALV